MTTDPKDMSAAKDALDRNLQKIDGLSKRLTAAMSQSRQISPSLQGPGQDLFVKAQAAYWSAFIGDPAKLIEHQVGYWSKTLKHYVEAQQSLAQGRLEPARDETKGDRRFSNPLWETHPYFNFLKQQYLMTAEAVSQAVDDVEGLEEADKQRLAYFTRQVVDMMAPTNFLGTNPDALSKAVETQGQSLVDGLENLVTDLEKNSGDLLVQLADDTAFQVGVNIATTPGKVVYRNRMLELIQYTPSTEKVHKTPLVVFPPWINKFYVLDLSERNSLLKWAVDQGFTVFVVSWANPDASYAEVGIDDYVTEGYLAAIDAAKAITGEKQVNTVGYCIGGTTLAMTAALLKKRGDTSIKSATFFTTLTDFSEQGEFGAFLGNDFVDGIEAEALRAGYLDKFYMARTFSYLRSNDLIYGPAIKSYMMGQAPPAFDLLYWNGDGTNLPAKMAIEYLRWLCQDDLFARGKIEICGERLDLSGVTVPVCSIACETDHIAAWKASFAGWQQMGSRNKTFILSESGHIAGIINPPSKKKYGHFVNDANAESADAWQAAASKEEGSWWPRWGAWLAKQSGARVKARTPGNKEYQQLADAPGTYVLK